MEIDKSRSPIAAMRPRRTQQSRQPALNWAKIPKGTPIEILKNWQRLAFGLVDDVMPDGSGLWLAREDDGERKFYLQNDGLQVVRLS